MSYEVMIDVRHHAKHCDDWEQKLSTAFKLGETEEGRATEGASYVVYALREWADELERKAGLTPLTAVFAFEDLVEVIATKWAEIGKQEFNGPGDPDEFREDAVKIARAITDATNKTGRCVEHGTWPVDECDGLCPQCGDKLALAATGQQEAVADSQPTPYARAFRERVCPVPEFPSVEKGTHE